MREWGGLRPAIRRGFAPEKLKKEQILSIDWGNTQSMGGDFLFLENDAQNLLFFNKMVGRVGIEPATN
jgi:hypothetical protein